MTQGNRVYRLQKNATPTAAATSLLLLLLLLVLCAIACEVPGWFSHQQNYTLKPLVVNEMQGTLTK
jgi:hypothetical protein